MKRGFVPMNTLGKGGNARPRRRRYGPFLPLPFTPAWYEHRERLDDRDFGPRYGPMTRDEFERSVLHGANREAYMSSVLGPMFPTASGRAAMDAVTRNDVSNLRDVASRGGFTYNPPWHSSFY